MEKRLGLCLLLFLVVAHVGCIDLSSYKARKNRKLGQSGSQSNEDLVNQEIADIETEKDGSNPDALQESEQLDNQEDDKPVDLKTEIKNISNQIESLQEKLNELLSTQQHQHMVKNAKKHPSYNYVSHGPYAYGFHPFGPYGMGFHDNLHKTKDAGGPLDGKGPNFGNGQFQYMVNDRMYPQMGMPFMGPGMMYPFY